ncbi:ribosomal RNA-processing protein 7 homolog A [Camponotus floridanus]|nr:ribosomal RNA-processing protein 7 homolog A [Camponotus floridanus]
MKTNMENTKGFKTLWICFDANDSDKHQLFLKEHSVRNQEPEYPRNHTLFVLNIPPYATTDCLKHAFIKLCGDIHLITFSKAKGFKTAYIVFKKESSLDKALELSDDYVITLSSDENMCLTGLRKWCKKYNDSLYNENVTKKQAEEYLTLYDNEIKNRIEQIAEEDDDGWVTIAGGKKRGQFAPSRKESTIGKVQEKEEQRKKKKQLLNFYTFQIRETKKQQLAELRKKFELDKQRLQELKLKRTFKPF